MLQIVMDGITMRYEQRHDKGSLHYTTKELLTTVMIVRNLCHIVTNSMYRGISGDEAAVALLDIGTDTLFLSATEPMIRGFPEYRNHRSVASSIGRLCYTLR